MTNVAVLVPGLQGVEAFVLHPFELVHRAAHRGPVAVALAHREGYPLAVGALIVVPEDVARAAPVLPLELGILDERDAVLHSARPYHAAEVGHVHPLAVAVAFSRYYRAEDAVAEHDSPAAWSAIPTA